MYTISLQKNKNTKIHAGINIKTRHVLFNKSTTWRTSEISVLSEAINNVAGKIDMIFADSGYDYRCSYLLFDHETKVVIPPRSNTEANKHTHQRNEAIE